MLKSNLGLHFNLSKLSLLGLANLFLLPVVGVYSAYGQLVSNSLNYYCQSYRGQFATMGQSILGSRPVVTWDNRQEICNTVSARFRLAKDNGHLRFLMKDRTRVCGTDRDQGECLSLLFSTDTVPNANYLWAILRANNPISGRYITQSTDGTVEYFNLELYLETAPISTNQEISTTQLSSEP